jgi:hypothetical protein
MAATEGIAVAQIGTVTAERLIVYRGAAEAETAALVNADPAQLKAAWQAPLKW